MITRAEAEEIAAHWAQSESEQRGYRCEPMLAEFDLGYLVWTRQPAAILPVPGDGARTVIDRASGLVTTWPAIPIADVAALYRDRRPSPSRTVDPSIALRRAARRRPSPATVATVTVNGRPFRAQGAKGDQNIEHHPLVARYLDGLDAGSRVRGVARHAELIAVSDALHEADRARSRAMTLDEVRAGLITAEFEAHLVRDTGDPAGGRPARPCETCLGALVDFALLPWSDLAFAAEWRHGAGHIPEPGRFPVEVARTLAGGGWRNHGSRAVFGEAAITRAVEASGGRLRPFPAARRFVGEFGGVRCGRRGPGLRRAVRLLTLDPLPGAYAADALADFAQVIGTGLFPIGVEGGDAIVAVDEAGRVFVLDQAGEWFVGESIDAALVSLVAGDGTASRVRDDGTW